MLLYGIVVLIHPNLFTDNLEIYASVKMDELKITHGKLSEYIDMVIQLNGGLNAIIGAVGTMALYKSFKIKEKWLLVVIFITNILGYLAPMTFDQITGVLRYPKIIEIFSFTFSLIAFIIIGTENRK